MIHIANRTYEVVVDHKNGWKPEALRDRYSEVLERYDYIVGDWGYNQLRLRGFFKETHPKATKETSIATLQDYLNEYCNFGCAYFIIEKVPSKQQGNPDTAGGTEGDEEVLLVSNQEEQVPLSETGGTQNAPAADTPKQPAQQQESKPSEHRERPHHSKDKPHHRRNQQRHQGQGQSHNQNNKSPKQHVKQP